MPAQEFIKMTSRPVEALARIVDRRSPVIEPLTIVAVVSLITAWTIQPFVAHALTPMGAAAQGAAQVALWLSGVLAPLTALMKAGAAALACWSCAVYLGERLPLVKLVSMFCVAETTFAVRDLALAGVLVARGIESVHSTSDLMVAFGVNAFLHSPSASARIAFESWDAFSVAWGLLTFWMIRALFRIDSRSSACMALVAFAFRTLFSAASLLYSL
jgi:hypothetical protein